MGCGANRDTALLHGLQQSRLGLGRRTIDLIGQKDVGEDRAFLEVEMFFAGVALVHHVTPHDITRHEVGRELDAREGQMQNVGDRRHDLGLADTGNTLEQHVSLGKQADQSAVDDFIVTDDDLGDLFLDQLEAFGELTDLIVDLCGRHCLSSGLAGPKSYRGERCGPGRMAKKYLFTRLR